MPVMSRVEATFCRSAPWRGFAGRVALPWGLRHVEVGPKVLEIGGGSGAMAAALLDRDPTIDVTVTDVDAAMVAQQNEMLSAFPDRARAVVADATALDFESSTFDTVCSWLMLHHTIRWEDAINEAVRVLRPGGHLVGYDLTDSFSVRVVHRIDPEHTRLISPPDLNDVLGTIDDIEQFRVERALGGVMQRFVAMKSGT